MELSRFAYFVKIAEAGSISRAALALGVAQPALSRFVRQLEEDLDCILFERNGRGVTMTDAGRRLYGSAIDVLGRVQKAEAAVAGQAGPALGAVTLGISSLLASVWGPRIVGRFRKRWPRVRLRISEARNSTLFNWIEHGQADVAIAFREDGVWSARQKTLAGESFGFVAHRHLKRGSSQALSDSPLVLAPAPDVVRSRLEQTLGEGDEPLRIICQTDSVACMKGLVGAGLCAALIPETLSEEFHALGDVASAPSLFSHDVVVATPANRPLLPHARLLYETVLAEA